MWSEYEKYNSNIKTKKPRVSTEHDEMQLYSNNISGLNLNFSHIYIESHVSYYGFQVIQIHLLPMWDM